MKSIFKLFIAFLLTVCLALATVVCCCVAPAVMAHFHKIPKCSHCQDQSSNNHFSNTSGTCQYYLTSAALSRSQTISSSVKSLIVSIDFVSFNKHLTPFLPSSQIVYPPGGPSLIANTVSIYLSTHSLRI